MAEEDAEAQEEEEAEAAPAARPVRQPSLLRYLPIVVVVLLLQAVGAYFGIQKLLFPEAGPTVEEEGGRKRVIPEGDAPETAVDLGELIANPRGTRARLLVRTRVTLGVAPKGVASEIESDKKLDAVKDAVLWELGNATYEELSTPAGRDTVKVRIRDRVNGLLYEGRVQTIYFEEFILQAMSGYGKK